MLFSRGDNSVSPQELWFLISQRQKKEKTKMSSLVAYYASSDESEENDDEEERKNDLSTTESQLKEGKESQKDIKVTINQSAARNVDKNNSTTTKNSSPPPQYEEGKHAEENMFRVLPTPSMKPDSSAPRVIPEDDLEDLVKPKKSQMTQLPKPLSVPKRHRVQISIPTLDSDSDEEEIVTKKKPKFSGSGNLLDILPPPKHMSIKQANRSLIPHTLSKKPLLKPSGMKVPNINAKKSSATSGAAKILTDYNNSDEDDDEIKNGSDFFSLDTDSKKTPKLTYSSAAPLLHTINRDLDLYSVSLPPPPPSAVVTSVSLLQDSHVDSSQPHTEIQAYPQYEAQSAEPLYQPNVYEPQPSYSDPDLSNMDDLLQDEQFLRLQGKNQRGKERIKIMDVNTDDFIDPSELTKTLTQEMPKHSYKKNKDAPSKQSRSKHQITYLAYQAKERELELKNQWSQNRMTKRQTQAKYGF